MQRYTFGKLLHRFRKEKGLKIAEICSGLCSESMFKGFEKEIYIPNVLLFERFLERMGISQEEISFMLYEEEYEYYMWREGVCEVIEKAEWEKFEYLLSTCPKENFYSKETLGKQFFAYVNGIKKGIEKSYIEATSFLEYAGKLTMPSLVETVKQDIFLSTLELHILMLYLNYGVLGGIITKQEGKQWFLLMEQYLSQSKVNINERAKCYPKLICIGLHLFQNNMKEREQIQVCQKAIDILRKNRNFHDITELFRLYLPILKRREDKKVSFYQKQYEVFCDLLQEEGFDIGFWAESLIQGKPKIYLISEYFLAKRMEKGITQETLSEGICEPETYSRIETGKQIARKKNTYALAEKLEIGWCYYRGELDTHEVKAFQLRRKQRTAFIRGRTWDGLDLLDDLEECLDMNTTINYQYITLFRTIGKYRLKQLGVEETCKTLESLLHLTQKMDEDTSKLVYYTQTELEIVGYLAQVLRENGKYKEGILLCETVIKQMGHSILGFEQQWSGFSFVFRILSCLYFAMEQYEDSIKTAEYVKHENMRRRKGESLANILDIIADDLEHMGKQYSTKYEKLYRYTYYMADFFYVEDVMYGAKKYYEENFEKGFAWYEY